MSSAKAETKNMSCVRIDQRPFASIPRSSHASREANERRQQRESPGRKATRGADRIRIKRAYDAASAQDGHRVLVDHIWPRGLSKELLRIDSWLKKIAPSSALRKWFGHEPRRWEEFRRRYHAELQGKPEETTFLLKLAREGIVTLVYAARDKVHNNALALAEYLRGLESSSWRS